MTNCPVPKTETPPCPDNACRMEANESGVQGPYTLQSALKDYPDKSQSPGHEKLKSLLEQHPSETVYMYVIESIQQDNSGSYWQTGCAPNFQGGAITLCTCKHWMRTFKPVEDWKQGVWIAGFAGLTHTAQQSLVYLTRVGELQGMFTTTSRPSL